MPLAVSDDGSVVIGQNNPDASKADQRRFHLDALHRHGQCHRLARGQRRGGQPAVSGHVVGAR